MISLYFFQTLYHFPVYSNIEGRGIIRLKFKRKYHVSFFQEAKNERNYLFRH